MKRILITGCSSGFGYNASKYLAEKGHHVYATMRNVEGKNQKSATELKEFAKDKNLKLEVFDMDVTSDDSVNLTVAKIPKIDVLINNAGLGYGGAVEAFSSAQVMDQLDLNIVGTIRTAKAVLPKMRAQKSGLIIQLSSGAGRIGVPGFGVYNASKWGLEGLSEALRYELSPFGIDVAIVEPGPFSTKFFENIVPSEGANISENYPQIGAFMQGFQTQVMAAFENADAPTDPMMVVHAFEELINLPTGKRPLRTLVGLDFGVKHLNEVTEKVRKEIIQPTLGLTEMDGPQLKSKEKTV